MDWKMGGKGPGKGGVKLTAKSLENEREMGVAYTDGKNNEIREEIVCHLHLEKKKKIDKQLFIFSRLRR